MDLSLRWEESLTLSRGSFPSGRGFRKNAPFCERFLISLLKIVSRALARSTALSEKQAVSSSGGNSILAVFFPPPPFLRNLLSARESDCLSTTNPNFLGASFFFLTRPLVKERF